MELLFAFYGSSKKEFGTSLQQISILKWKGNGSIMDSSL